MSTQVDPETMPLEDLRQMAEQEFQQARDEQGRFASNDVKAASGRDDDPAPAVDDQPDEIVYRRVIDLEDGSGTQVFEGASPEELIEKLAEAQKHATRKIRELATAQKVKETVAELSDDERFVLGQEFLSKPDVVLAREVEKRVKAILDERLAPVEKLTKAQQEFSAGQEFQQIEPNYYPTPKNGQRIEKWIRMEGLSATVENIQKAFADLSESGLLETRPDTQDAETRETRTVQPRIAEPATRIVGQRRAASGLSSRGSASAPRSQEPTEAELYNMPLEKLRELANADARRQR